MQTGLFDIHDRLGKLNKNQDPLAQLNRLINWEQFRPTLEQKGYRGHLQRKGNRHKKLTEWEKQGNRTRSMIRSRVEHIFGIQAMTAGSLILRTIGLTRAKAKIGLRNLAYNMTRYKTLVCNGG